jgi:hypothetical protein
MKVHQREERREERGAQDKKERRPIALALRLECSNCTCTFSFGHTREGIAEFCKHRDRVPATCSSQLVDRSCGPAFKDTTLGIVAIPSFPVLAKEPTCPLKPHNSHSLLVRNTATMWILPLVGYLGLALGFSFLTLAIASGLYYLSELVEEHTVLAKKLLTRLIYLIVAIQVLLALFDKFPLGLSALAIASHAVYHQNLRRFPIVKLTDPIFLLSCGMFTHIHDPFSLANVSISTRTREPLAMVPPFLRPAFISSQTLQLLRPERVRPELQRSRCLLWSPSLACTFCTIRIFVCWRERLAEYG